MAVMRKFVPAQRLSDEIESWTNGWQNQSSAQDYANRSLAQVSNYYVRPREMTAADLGLERDCYSGKCESPRICRECDGCLSGTLEMLRFVSGGQLRTDAPYSFWLGANA